MKMSNVEIALVEMFLILYLVVKMYWYLSWLNLYVSIGM